MKKLSSCCMAEPATHSSVEPCTIVETTTTKNTALKIVSLCGTSDESTKVARTIGTAPRSPAQPRSPVRKAGGQTPGHVRVGFFQFVLPRRRGAELARRSSETFAVSTRRRGPTGETWFPPGSQRSEASEALSPAD